MKRLQIRKWISVLFLVLLSLTLGLVFLSGGLVLADSPLEDPPAPILAKLDPLLPPDGALSPQNIGSAATGIFYPSDDAPVQQGAPNSTDPNNFYLGAGYYSGIPSVGADGLVRSYIRFDLSSLPANSIISSATLRLYQAGGADFPDQNRTVTLYRVTSSWNEATITWNNKPAFAEAIGSVTTTYDFSGWLTVEGMALTDLVRGWANGSTDNYGLVAIGPESIQGIYRVFASGETANSPELQINYLPPAPPVLDASPGTFSFQTASSEPPFNPSIQISNVTGNSLDWTATKVGSASWLTLNSPSGTGVTSTNPANLSLTINPAGLTPGSYTEQILINSITSNVENSPLTTTVNLEVFSQLSKIYLPTIVKSGAGGSSAPRVVALIIGIDDYEALGPAPISGNLPEEWGFDLKHSGHDADDVFDVTTSEFGGPPGSLVAIRLGDTHKTDTIQSNSVIPATRANIVAAFGTVDQLENEDTLVIIYYSGHGGQNPDQNGDESDGLDEFIAASDTDVVPGAFIDILTDDDLQVLLANLESEHILIVIDSCFSGGLTGAAIETTEMGDLRPRGLVSPFTSSSISAQADMSEIAGPGRLVITGGTGDQLTWESDSLQNGVFTYHFLQAWQDALHDTNQNGYISAEEAYWFSRDVTDEFIFNAQGVHQNPAINDQYFGQVELR